MDWKQVKPSSRKRSATTPLQTIQGQVVLERQLLNSGATFYARAGKNHSDWLSRQPGKLWGHISQPVSSRTAAQVLQRHEFSYCCLYRGPDLTQSRIQRRFDLKCCSPELVQETACKCCVL